MDGSGIEIFKDDGNEIQLPTGMQSESEKLQSSGVEDAITGDTVKSIILSVENSIILPNYVLRLVNVQEIPGIVARSIESFVRADGDTHLYIYADGGMKKIGMGNSLELGRILSSAISMIFGDSCIIYKDYQVGEPLNIVKGRDLKKLRLNI